MLLLLIVTNQELAMNNLLYPLLLLFLLACNTKQKDSGTVPVDTIAVSIDTVSPPVISKVKPSKPKGVSCYVDRLQKFYSHPDYYVSLYYRDNFDEQIHDTLTSSNAEIVSQNHEERRFLLNEELAKKHMVVEGLDTLVVFNEAQQVIDTLFRNDFEFYEDMITSSFIATYTSGSNYEDNVVASINALDFFVVKKTEQFTHCEAFTTKMCNKHDLNPDYVVASGSTIFDKDSVSFISYTDYHNNFNSIYIIKNGVKVDSLQDDFVFWDLKPVPLSDAKEWFYLAYCNVPDTDIYWTALLSLNRQSYKLKLYNRGRIE